MIGKGFELDLSVGYQQKRTNGESTDFYDSATYLHHDKVQTLRTALLLRHHFLKINKTNLFAHGGISLAHYWINNGTEVVYPSSYLPLRKYKWNTRTGALHFGISARHRLAKKLSAIGLIDVRYNENLHLMFSEQHQTNWSLCGLVGVAYHF